MRNDFNFFNAWQYEAIEEEIEKRKKRDELEILMLEFLARGGKIRRVKVKGSPRPKFKYQNRKQRKDSEDE